MSVTDREQVLKAILDSGIVGIIRTTSADQAHRAITAILEGGLSVIEVTFTVPGAVDIIRQLDQSIGQQTVIGAGTVLTPEDVHAAIAAGARFLVAPNTNPAVIAAAKQYPRVVIPGTLSPTEVVSALQAGADMVKIFPANIVGPGYLRDLRGPLPNVLFLPTGGLDLTNAADWLRAGAAALGVGGNILDKKAMAEGRWEVLTQNARAFVQLVQETRAALSRGR